MKLSHSSIMFLPYHYEHYIIMDNVALSHFSSMWSNHYRIVALSHFSSMWSNFSGCSISSILSQLNCRIVALSHNVGHWINALVQFYWSCCDRIIDAALVIGSYYDHFYSCLSWLLATYHIYLPNACIIIGSMD